MLVDAGLGARPRAILMTHGHFDHVGSLRELAGGWGVPVYAHPLEMPYLTGRSKYPPPDPAVGGGMMAYLSPPAGAGRVLVAGDAFVTTKQEFLPAAISQRPELHGPPAIACGHGRPMAGPETMDALRFLADNFDRVARPAHGRYAGHPAVTGERGLVSVPPPGLVYIRNAALLIGAGVAAGAVLLARRRRAR